MPAPNVDLTPFGFTPTESLVYAALLGMGMASGYAVGKELNLARANAYQALHGLVAKGAAERIDEAPQRFEAITPATLMAQLTRSRSEQLDRLERQLRGEGETGGRSLMPIESRRSLLDLALRTAARSPGPVLALADADTLAAMAPIWRKRAADGSDTRLWVIGAEVLLAVPTAGIVEPAKVDELFGTASITLLVTSEAAMLARDAPGDRKGHWTSHPLLVSAMRGAFLQLTASTSSVA